MRILRGPLPERGMLQPLDLQGPQTPNRGPEEIRIRGTDRLLLASELHWFRAPRRPRTRYRSWAWRLRGAYKQRRLRPPRSAGEVRPSDCAPTRASNLEGGPHTTCGKQCDRGDERGTGAYTSHERRLGAFCGLRFPRPSATLIAGLLSCASSTCRRTRERRTADTCRLKGRRRLYGSMRMAGARSPVQRAASKFGSELGVKTVSRDSAKRCGPGLTASNTCSSRMMTTPWTVLGQQEEDVSPTDTSREIVIKK